MKRLILLLFAAMAIGAYANHTFTDETVRYKVMYKWGLINKQAGTATITGAVGRQILQRARHAQRPYHEGRLPADVL